MPDNERGRRLEELHSGALKLGAGERDEFTSAVAATRNFAAQLNRCWAMNRSWTPGRAHMS